MLTNLSWWFCVVPFFLGGGGGVGETVQDNDPLQTCVFPADPSIRLWSPKLTIVLHKQEKQKMKKINLHNEKSCVSQRKSATVQCTFLETSFLSTHCCEASVPKTTNYHNNGQAPFIRPGMIISIDRLTLIPE